MQGNASGQNLTFYKCVIQAGHIAYSIGPSYICAVCGNGVLVTIQDPVRKIGGMAHCVFPNMKSFQKPTNYHSNIAVVSLYKKLNQHRSLSRRAEAQIFGGGNLNGIKRKRARELIKNIKEILTKLNINLVSEDIGGDMGRKVMLNTYSGECFVYKTRKVRTSDWLPEFPRI